MSDLLLSSSRLEAGFQFDSESVLLSGIAYLCGLLIFCANGPGKQVVLDLRVRMLHGNSVWAMAEEASRGSS